MKTRVVIFVVVIAILLVWFFNRNRGYSIFTYLPVNENDEYVYNHREGPEDDVVTIKTKNVKQGVLGKHFDWHWQGKYNDRIQTCLLNSKGLFLNRNKHLTGEIPLKTIRVHTPPMLMIPSELKNKFLLKTKFLTYDYDENLIDTEYIEGSIIYLGQENITVEAGNFSCHLFLTTHSYKNKQGNTVHMHFYSFWLAKGVGTVKFIHIFVPLDNKHYISPESKTLMNRYSNIFFETFELKKACITGKKIGG